MWCKYPRLGLPAAQGLGSAGGISLLNGEGCVCVSGFLLCCCKWEINWSASFQLPERNSTVRLWLAASQHLHCWLYFTSNIPVLIPCGTSDISVRGKHLWCCSPRVVFQLCSWTPRWWCELLFPCSVLCSLGKTALQYQPGACGPEPFSNCWGLVLELTYSQNHSHFPQIRCIWCDPRCFFWNCWEEQTFKSVLLVKLQCWESFFSLCFWWSIHRLLNSSAC